jgi:hypothetical protein
MEVFEQHGLLAAFTWIVLIGVALLVYISQQPDDSSEDPNWLRISARISRYATALSLLWVLSYAIDKNWQPWPPMVVAFAVFDLLLLFRAVAVNLHVRRIKARRDQWAKTFANN